MVLHAFPLHVLSVQECCHARASPCAIRYLASNSVLSTHDFSLMLNGTSLLLWRNTLTQPECRRCRESPRTTPSGSQSAFPKNKSRFELSHSPSPSSTKSLSLLVLALWKSIWPGSLQQELAESQGLTPSKGCLPETQDAWVQSELVTVGRNWGQMLCLLPAAYNENSVQWELLQHKHLWELPKVNIVSLKLNSKPYLRQAPMLPLACIS